MVLGRDSEPPVPANCAIRKLLLCLRDAMVPCIGRGPILERAGVGAEAHTHAQLPLSDFRGAGPLAPSPTSAAIGSMKVFLYSGYSRWPLRHRIALT